MQSYIYTYWSRSDQILKELKLNQLATDPNVLIPGIFYIPRARYGQMIVPCLKWKKYLTKVTKDLSTSIIYSGSFSHMKNYMDTDGLAMIDLTLNPFEQVV